MMKRLLTLTAIALGLSSGVALADRHYGGGRGELRDHRGDDVRYRQDNRRWNTGDRNARVVRVERVRPTFRDNRFYFGANNYRVYHRPVINVRYRDYYRRPALISENYDPVAGYVWMQGNWEWNGYEWSWIPGHYDVDSSYHQHQVVDSNDDYDDDYGNNYDHNYGDTNDNTYYGNTYQQPYTPTPIYNSGVTVQGHISF